MAVDIDVTLADRLKSAIAVALRVQTDPTPRDIRALSLVSLSLVPVTVPSLNRIPAKPLAQPGCHSSVGAESTLSRYSFDRAPTDTGIVRRRTAAQQLAPERRRSKEQRHRGRERDAKDRRLRDGDTGWSVNVQHQLFGIACEVRDFDHVSDLFTRATDSKSNPVRAVVNPGPLKVGSHPDNSFGVDGPRSASRMRRFARARRSFSWHNFTDEPSMGFEDRSFWDHGNHRNRNMGEVSRLPIGRSMVAPIHPVGGSASSQDEGGNNTPRSGLRMRQTAAHLVTERRWRGGCGVI